MRVISFGLIATAAFTFAGSASAFVLDFEGGDFISGRIVDDQYSLTPQGANISAVNLKAGPDLAVIFDTGFTNGTDEDLASPFSSPNPQLDQAFDPGNVLIIQERNNCDVNAGLCDVADDQAGRRTGEIEFVFNQAVTMQSVDFFDVEFNENDNDPDSQVRLFDINDVEILPNTFFVPNTGGDNQWNQLVFGDVGGVKRMVVEFNGSGALDNVAYVPIPASVWLLGSALGALFGWKRRRATVA
ncbi:MAG: VPLPA-CTERM sorting domain-containing protein [Gammaproteobacteria bacterium]